MEPTTGEKIEDDEVANAHSRVRHESEHESEDCHGAENGKCNPRLDDLAAEEIDKAGKKGDCGELSR